MGLFKKNFLFTSLIFISLFLNLGSLNAVSVVTKSGEILQGSIIDQDSEVITMNITKIYTLKKRLIFLKNEKKQKKMIVFLSDGSTLQGFIQPGTGKTIILFGNPYLAGEMILKISEIRKIVRIVRAETNLLGTKIKGDIIPLKGSIVLLENLDPVQNKIKIMRKRVHKISKEKLSMEDAKSELLELEEAKRDKRWLKPQFSLSFNSAFLVSDLREILPFEVGGLFSINQGIDYMFNKRKWFIPAMRLEVNYRSAQNGPVSLLGTSVRGGLYWQRNISKKNSIVWTTTAGLSFFKLRDPFYTGDHKALDILLMAGFNHRIMRNFSFFTNIQANFVYDPIRPLVSGGLSLGLKYSL